MPTLTPLPGPCSACIALLAGEPSNGDHLCSQASKTRIYHGSVPQSSNCKQLQALRSALLRREGAVRSLRVLDHQLQGPYVYSPQISQTPLKTTLAVCLSGLKPQLGVSVDLCRGGDECAQAQPWFRLQQSSAASPAAQAHCICLVAHRSPHRCTSFHGK